MGNQSQYTYSNTTKWGDSRKRRYLVEVFRNLIPKTTEGMILLEVGPGRGEFASIVLDNDIGYIGVEPSLSLREDLEKKGLRILPDALPTINLPDSSVDIVYSYDVLEHLENYSTILSFFNESARVLKPGGHIVAIAPNAETLGILFYLYEYQHNYYTSVDRISTLLQDAGFEVQKKRRFLTALGSKNSLIYRLTDRFMAFIFLTIARSATINSILRLLLGENLLFKIHKNLYDHFCVVAKRP